MSKAAWLLWIPAAAGIGASLAGPDALPVCRHGCRGRAKPVDLALCAKEQERIADLVRPGLAADLEAIDLKAVKVGVDLPSCAQVSSLEVKLPGPVPQSAVGSKIAFLRERDIAGFESGDMSAVALVGRISLAQASKIETSPGEGRQGRSVIVASDDLARALGVSCAPCVVEITGPDHAIVQMGSR